MQLCCFSTSLEQADVCISCRSAGFAVTASPTKVAEQLCFGCQIGCCSTASSPWLHGERTCAGTSNGLCPISAQRLSLQMTAPQDGEQCGKTRLQQAALLHSQRGRHVLLWSDNALTVFCINHQDGTKSTWLPQVSPDLQTLAASHLYSLRAVYIPGEQNQLADLFSCQKPSLG